MSDRRTLVISSGVPRQIVDGDRAVTPAGIVGTATSDLTLEPPTGQVISLNGNTRLETGKLLTLDGQVASDITFENSTSGRRIIVAQVTSGAGKGIALQAGQGADANGTFGIYGGNAQITGGPGGHGSATKGAGAGGEAWVRGGSAGIDNGGGGGAGGTVRILAGPGTGAFNDGFVKIAPGNTYAVEIGNVTDNPGTTFLGSGIVKFDGTVELASTSVTEFRGIVGTTAAPNITFSNDNDHSLRPVQAAATVTGSGMELVGGEGGDASAALSGGDGGFVGLYAGTGGAGNATQNAGAGGRTVVAGGSAGTAGAGGGANGGELWLNGGLHSGLSGTADGKVIIGESSTSAIEIGNGVSSTTVTFRGLGLVTFNAGVELQGAVEFTSTSVTEFRGIVCSIAAPNIVFSNDNNHALLPTQSPATVDGQQLELDGGKGGNAGSGLPGGVGGLAGVFGGPGGNGTATLAAGAGGVTVIAGGQAGTAGAGGGAVGGDLWLNGGPKSGAFANGKVMIGSDNTSAIEIGEAIGNPTTTFLGTGIVKFNGNVEFATTSVTEFRGVIGTTAAPDVVFSNDNDHYIRAKQTATGVAGVGVGIQSGKGGNAGGGSPGGVGGLSFLVGGLGGNGTVALAAGDGGKTVVSGGGAGTNLGGGAGAGGDLWLNGGFAPAGSSCGKVVIAESGTSAIEVGNGVLNPPTSFLGIGIVTFNPKVYIEDSVRYSSLGAKPDGTGTSGKGWSYTKTVSTVTEFFYEDSSGNEVQITSGGSLNVTAAAGCRASGTSGEAIAIGAPVNWSYAIGVGTAVFNSDANSATATKKFVRGLCLTAAAASGVSVNVLLAGDTDVPDAIWDSVPVAADGGKDVYLSENSGKLTLTAPTGSASVVQRVGFVSRGGSGSVRVVVQPGEPVLLS
jgi:hypothetical protein